MRIGGITPIDQTTVCLWNGHMSKETPRPNPSTRSRRSLTLTVIGWILVVPFGAAAINAIYAFGVAYLTDMNQQTTSWMRIGAVVLLVLATPFALGGWALIRRGRRVSKQAQTIPQPIV